MTQQSEKHISTIDHVSYGGLVGQVAAATIASSIGPGKKASPGFSEQLWATGGEARAYKGDKSGEAMMADFSSYVASRNDVVTGEQLYLKARDLGIVDAKSALADQPLWMRLAYDAFASVAHLTSHRIHAEQTHDTRRTALEAADMERKIEGAAIAAWGDLRRADLARPTPKDGEAPPAETRPVWSQLSVEARQAMIERTRGLVETGRLAHDRALGDKAMDAIFVGAVCRAFGVEKPSELKTKTD